MSSCFVRSRSDLHREKTLLLDLLYSCQFVIQFRLILLHLSHFWLLLLPLHLPISDELLNLRLQLPYLLQVSRLLHLELQVFSRFLQLKLQSITLILSRFLLMLQTVDLISQLLQLWRSLGWCLLCSRLRQFLLQACEFGLIIAVLLG
jgi:hypothetical protein